MKKMGCAQCGKSMKRGGTKKMAKGGSANVNISKPGAGYAKAQTGGDNQKNFIYGMPTTTTANAGIATMKKGGTKKAKFGASVPVKHSPPVAMRHNDERTGFESVDSKKVGGSLKPVPAGKAGLSKLPTAVRNKMGYQKSGGTMKKATGGPIIDKLKAKLAERKVTKAIKKSVKSSGKIINK